MNNTERQPMPDGRIRIPRLLSERRKEALRLAKIEGLIVLNLHVVDFVPPETWIEYWFDKELTSEDELRSRIEKIIF